MANKNKCSCLDKAADDEPIFVLRAQDMTTPDTILEWIRINLESCPHDKLREAFETSLQMQQYHTRKMAD